MKISLNIEISRGRNVLWKNLKGLIYNTIKIYINLFILVSNYFKLGKTSLQNVFT